MDDQKFFLGLIITTEEANPPTPRDILPKLLCPERVRGITPKLSCPERVLRRRGWGDLKLLIRYLPG
jgi:hypothetical protein